MVLLIPCQMASLLNNPFLFPFFSICRWTEYDCVLPRFSYELAQLHWSIGRSIARRTVHAICKEVAYVCGVASGWQWQWPSDGPAPAQCSRYGALSSSWPLRRPEAVWRAAPRTTAAGCTVARVAPFMINCRARYIVNGAHAGVPWKWLTASNDEIISHRVFDCLSCFNTEII